MGFNAVLTMENWNVVYDRSCLWWALRAWRVILPYLLDHRGFQAKGCGRQSNLTGELTLQGLWSYTSFSFFFTFHHFLVLLLFFILFIFIFSSPFPLASFLPILPFLVFLLLFKSSLISGLYFGTFVSRHCLKFLTSDICISHSSIFQ